MIKRTMAIGILILLVLSLTGYISFDRFSEAQEKKLEQVYQTTIAQITESIAEQAEKCQPIQITSEVQLIDLRCLQAAEGATDE